jgi:hypothetical protein
MAGRVNAKICPYSGSAPHYPILKEGPSASSELVVSETLPHRAAFALGLANTGGSQSITNAYPAWTITQFEEGAR